jgi:hypothetical protein
MVSHYRNIFLMGPADLARLVGGAVSDPELEARLWFPLVVRSALLDR